MQQIPPKRLDLVRVLDPAPLLPVWEEARPMRWKRDDAADLLTRSESHLILLTRDGRIIRKQEIAPPGAANFGLDLLADVDGDGTDEAFVSWSTGQHFSIAVVDGGFRQLKQFTCEGPAHDGSPGRELPGAFRARCLADLDGDGKKELLAAVDTSSGLRSRGVRCYSYDTGQMLWHFDMTGSPVAVATMDQDSDGRLEVLVGTAAIGRGNVAPDGTKDDHSYVRAIGHEGKQIWALQLGRGGSRAWPVPGTSSAMGHRNCWSG